MSRSFTIISVQKNGLGSLVNYTGGRFLNETPRAFSYSCNCLYLLTNALVY